MNEQKYIESLENENQALKENVELRKIIENLRNTSKQLLEERDDLDRQLTMCETVMWKLGLEALSEKRDMISFLANSVKKMQEESPESDVESIVNHIYNKFKTPTK